MTTQHKHAAVLRAIADGKAAEFWSDSLGKWVEGNAANPIEHENLEWRIKPEPVEAWLNLYHNGAIGVFYGPAGGVLAKTQDTNRVVSRVKVLIEPGRFD